MDISLENKIVLSLCSYATNNRYAYKYDNKDDPDSEMKITNFVPTYDKWCLFCDNKNCSLRCSKCKYVFFCNKDCQKKSWKIHKKHCGRDLFTLCITCGVKNTEIKCESKNCKAGYCSEKCKKMIHNDHLFYDCENLKIS